MSLLLNAEIVRPSRTVTMVDKELRRLDSTRSENCRPLSHETMRRASRSGGHPAPAGAQHLTLCCLYQSTEGRGRAGRSLQDKHRLAQSRERTTQRQSLLSRRSDRQTQAT